MRICRRTCLSSTDEILKTLWQFLYNGSTHSILRVPSLERQVINIHTEYSNIWLDCCCLNCNSTSPVYRIQTYTRRWTVNRRLNRRSTHADLLLCLHGIFSSIIINNHWLSVTHSNAYFVTIVVSTTIITVSRRHHRGSSGVETIPTTQPIGHIWVPEWIIHHQHWLWCPVASSNSVRATHSELEDPKLNVLCREMHVGTIVVVVTTVCMINQRDIQLYVSKALVCPQYPLKYSRLIENDNWCPIGVLSTHKWRIVTPSDTISIQNPKLSIETRHLPPRNPS